ncbi:TPA: glycosyltransferase family 1 protein, partial [Candidatus Bipolaricaulota bacterium]|nr:glycosyltransferase family 1 protein [Candidatus Bipolaricaulota bacterium]
MTYLIASSSSNNRIREDTLTEMLAGQNILCFATDRWSSIWRNRHQIMSRLARTNRVLYVEPYTYPANEALKALVKLQERGAQLEHIADNLWVYQHPTWGFISRWAILDQLGLRLRVLALRQVLKKLQMESPILWVVDPRHRNMVGHFKESLVCYHVVDNYAAAPWRSAQARAVMEAEERFMLSVADLVLVTSPTLLADKKRHNSNVHLVRNAVDYAQFAAAMKGFNAPPQDMAAIPSPIIGYVGAVNNKLDYKLLDTIARAKPSWSFVLVGPLSNQPDSAAWQFAQDHPPNVYLLGQREVTEVPYYIQACQVCLLPYRRDNYTKSINSLKLYEYLACEKPIVATDIPIAREHSHVVYIAKDVADFVRKLERALEPINPERRALQRSIA